MRYNDYSHRHGKELLHVLHPRIFTEIQTILEKTHPFPHGAEKGLTAKNHLTDAFAAYGWEMEGMADFSTDKKDALDLCKWKVAIELEFSRFETSFASCYCMRDARSTSVSSSSLMRWHISDGKVA